MVVVSSMNSKYYNALIGCAICDVMSLLALYTPLALCFALCAIAIVLAVAALFLAKEGKK